MHEVLKTSRSGASECGVAILMVILMIAIGLTILVALGDSTYIAMRLNSAAERRVKAEYILKSAVNVAAVLIENDKNSQEDPLTDDWMKFQQGLEAPGAMLGIDEPNVRVSLLIASEQGKIPLLQLKDTGAQGNPSTNVQKWAPVLLRLMKNLGVGNSTADGPPVVPEQLVANLVDYLDTNKDAFSYQSPSGESFQGTENTLSEEEELRNEGKIESVASELSAVPGFTPDVIQKILPYVSISNFAAVNINAAPEQVLMALDASMTQQLAAQIIQQREQQPFTTGLVSELTAIVGGSIAGNLTSASGSGGNKVTHSGNIFEVIAKVDYGNAAFMASATLNKSGGRAGGGGGPKIESLLIY
jgi:type II secretory pathway component PulK